MNMVKNLSCVVLAISFVLGIAAEASAGGSVSGTVTNTSSEGVANALVMAYLDANSEDWTNTDGDGAYSISGLDAGTYEIHLLTFGYEFRIEPNVVITDGNNTTKNVTSLAAEGKIMGTVTQSDESTPVAGVLVIVSDGSGFSMPASTDANGNYTIGMLPAGSYTVIGAKANYSFPDSENAQVQAGQTTADVDHIGLSGKISGKITESNGTTAIEDASVLAIGGNDALKGMDITDSSGNYDLTGLATGTYTVKVLRDDASKIAEASSVSVTDGQTTTRNLSAGGGSISGAVTDSSQNAIEGAVLTARKDSDIYEAVSNASGNYTISALPAGQYQLTVDPNGNDYVATKIDDVTVTPGQQTSGQDFALGQAGKITGTVTNSSQQAIEGALVTAIDPNDAMNDANVTFIGTTTDSSGDYTANYLRTGTYTIIVAADGYVSDSETDVSVTAGQTTSGKNFTLGTSGGSISGTVYESDGQTPIENASVYCIGSGLSCRYTSSDSSGDYILTLLQAGTYEVMAYVQGYDFESLTNIVVTGTQENSGNDLTLDEEE